MSKTQTVPVMDIPLEEIEIWEEANVRRRQITEGIDELAESIKRIGLQQPVVVQQDDGKYKLIIGQRRYLACKQLGLKKIRALVQQPVDEIKARIASMAENIHRRDIAARDKAIVCKALLDKFGTPKAVAEELGVTEQTVRKWLGYHAVAEPIKKMVEEKKITAVEAIKISSNVPEEKKAIRIAEKIAEAKMTKPEKERVFDAVEEEPAAPVERIFRRAEEKKIQKEIHFVLPEKVAKAMDKASEDEEKEPDELAKDIVVDWLRTNRYF
jgi:ParB family chromosome partitioning protein